jgi:hypothetical protein
VQGSHAWAAGGAVFDEANLISAAGLVPVMELAERTGLSELLDEHVRFGCELPCVNPSVRRPLVDLG